MHIKKISTHTLIAILICIIGGCSSTLEPQLPNSNESIFNTSEIKKPRFIPQESSGSKTFEPKFLDNNGLQNLKVLPIEGLTGSKQVTLTNAMADVLQNSAEIAQALQNKPSKMIKLAGKISIEEERDNIIWLKINWSLLTDNDKKFADHTGKVIIDATQWDLASKEAINLITNATSPNVFNMIQKYSLATSKVNKIADDPNVINTETFRYDGNTLKIPTLTNKSPTSVPFNPKNTLLYVDTVRGAPGDGNLSLTAALKLALKADQLSLTNNEEASDFTIRGNVLVGKKSNNQQLVKITWTITTKDGAEIGKAVQTNKVPAGRLNAEWGILSDLISDAAVFGIAKLCKLPQNNRIIDSPN